MMNEKSSGRSIDVSGAALHYEERVEQTPLA
jgi:hypothetical protein